MKDIKNFTKTHKTLVCIDSDGTAIDSMTSKHKLAFGPCFVKEWGFERKTAEVLALWCDINLHGKTRGMNRFITLVMCLEKLRDKGYDVGELKQLKDWVETTDKLSNDRLTAQIEKTNDVTLKKALAWSLATNDKIATLSYDDKKAFDGAKDFLAYASGVADIAIVSSANASSVKEEWGYFGLSEYVSVMTSQEQGTKKDCINALLAHGYDKNNVLMVGDAPPDHKSAMSCGVHFYPIITDSEPRCWRELKDVYFEMLMRGVYGEAESMLIEKFLKG